MTDVATVLDGLQWFIVALDGSGRGTLPLPGARDIEVEDLTDLLAAVAGARRVAIDNRCQTDDV